MVINRNGKGWYRIKNTNLHDIIKWSTKVMEVCN